MPSDNPGRLPRPPARTARLRELVHGDCHRCPDDHVRAIGMVSAPTWSAPALRAAAGDRPQRALDGCPRRGWTKTVRLGVGRGWIHGRGVAVSKSDFANYAGALRRSRHRRRARGTVELHLTYDEEAAEHGTVFLLRRASQARSGAQRGFSTAWSRAQGCCTSSAVDGQSAHAASFHALTRSRRQPRPSALYSWRKTLAGGFGDRRIGSRSYGGLIKAGSTPTCPDRVTFVSNGG